MADFCTCGAQLPPDALFCHKCGKPQREIAAPAPEVTPEITFPPQPPAPPPATLSFRNPAALQSSLMVAIMGGLLSWVPFLNVILWLVSGYVSVFLYRRRTGDFLNIRAGLRIGWITGVMMFAIVAVFFTGFIILFNVSGGAEVFQAQFRNGDPRMAEALKILQNGSDIALLFAELFVLITCLSMAGGALGAKLGGGSNGPAK